MRYIKKYDKFPYTVRESNENELIRSEFTSYIFGLDNWYQTNLMHYKRPGFETSEIVNEYVLYSSDIVLLSLDEREESGIETTMDSSIEYFIRGEYNSDDYHEVEYHVYLDGEFRLANSQEEEHLRNVDMEYSLVNQPFVDSIGIEDWVGIKSGTLDVLTKLNQ